MLLITAAYEVEMKKVVKEALPITRFTKSREEAIAFFKEKNEPYKVELIEDLPEDAEISFYQQGEFVDLCAEMRRCQLKRKRRK